MGNAAPIIPGPRFNPEAFYLALDKQRRARVISWRQVAREARIVNSSVGPRLGRGADVHGDTLIRLLLWLGEHDIRPYVTDDAVGGEPA